MYRREKAYRTGREKSALPIFLLLSLLLNGAFFGYVLSRVPLAPEPDILAPPLVVDLVPPPEPKKKEKDRPRRIVENRNVLDERPPEKADYLSERDSRVEKEQRGRRGEGALAPLPGGKKAAEPSAEKKTPVSKTAEAPDRPGDVERPEARKKPSLEKLRPSPLRLSRLVFPGDNISPPEEIERSGKLTFLNTKSYRYAGFVRRVAYQIFDHFRAGLSGVGWNEYEMMRKRREFLIEAIMDPLGNPIEVRLVKSSGLNKWDELGLAAMRKGAWDLNPPRGVAGSDGNIHFLFTTDSRYMIAGISD